MTASSPGITPEYQTPARVVRGDPRHASTVWRWGAFMLAPAIWGIPVAILCGLVALITGLAFIPVAGWVLAPLVTLMLLGLMLRARQRSRERNGAMILDYLETAVRLNLPLPQFLQAAEASERGRVRRQLHVLRIQLEAHGVVAAAVASIPDVSDKDASTLAAFESLGQLRTALIRLREERERAANDRDETLETGLYRYYAMFMLVLFPAFLVAFAIFITPKFREIFKDFKTELPPLSDAVFSIGNKVGENPWLTIPLLGVVALAVYFTMTLYMQRLILPFMPEPRFVVVWRWLKWRLPFFHGLERDAGMAAACELWSQAVEAGVPLPTAVAQSTELDVNPGFRFHLIEFGTHLAQGKPLSEAAQKAHLPDLLVGLLAPLSAGGAGGAGPAAAPLFAFLARYYRQKFSRTLLTLRAAVVPLAVFSMGAIVLMITASVILALTTLLNSVMDAPRGAL